VRWGGDDAGRERFLFCADVGVEVAEEVDREGKMERVVDWTH
jgi:hypothetical protein